MIPYVLSFFKKYDNLSSQILICSYELVWGFHWSMVNLLGRISLKEIDSPSTSSHQLSIAPHLEVGTYRLCSYPCYSIDWLGLVQATPAADNYVSLLNMFYFNWIIKG